MGVWIYCTRTHSSARYAVTPRYQTSTNLCPRPPPTSASNCSLMESTQLTLDLPLWLSLLSSSLPLPPPSPLHYLPPQLFFFLSHHPKRVTIFTLRTSTKPTKVIFLPFLQIQQWEQNLERFNMDLFRMRCYLASLQGGELPNPKSLLAIASRPTKTTLGRLGIFSVSSFHALVRNPRTCSGKGKLSKCKIKNQRTSSLSCLSWCFVAFFSVFDTSVLIYLMSNSNLENLRIIRN